MNAHAPRPVVPNPPEWVVLRKISKRFGGVEALRNVSLGLRRGEIHCLVGENGCGKSTLIKILAGAHAPDAGTLEIDGRSQTRLHAREAVRLGIQVIFQDFALFPNLTVAENIALATLIERGRWRVRQSELRRIAVGALETIGVELDPDQAVGGLAVGQQQLVAIARSLQHAARLLIMDEPTAALTQRETGRLFRLARALAAEGVTVLLVTHKIPEVFALAHRVTVLRNGEIAAEGPVDRFDAPLLVEAMTGRAPADHVPTVGPVRAADPPRLAVRQFRPRGDSPPVDFALQAGEIVGMAGRLGAGRSALVRGLFGLPPPVEGELWIDGQRMDLRHPAGALAAGIAYVPEDRLGQGLFARQSVARNLVAGTLAELGSRWGWLDRQRVRAQAAAWVSRLHIQTADPEAPVQLLSGGNQQKVVLARWLARETRVLLLNRPTAGVDVAARAEIHDLLRGWAAQGTALLLITDDLPELLQLAHRILVVHEGRILEERAAAGCDEAWLAARLEALP